MVTLDWLISQLEDQKERLDYIDYEDSDAPEDHLKINLTAGLLKLSKYYALLKDSTAYYAATRLYLTYKHFLETA